MKRWLRGGALAVVAFTLLAILAGCSQHATSTSDTHVCVFDGSERGGQKLKFQIPPGAPSRKIDDNDQQVKIPASNRFYMASKDDNVRDPLAPQFYTGFAKGSVPVQVQGQVRFKFNLEKACEWYSKHGRRNADNGDLQFNARGAEATQSGWLKYLAENFGVTMAEVVQERLGTYDWAAMAFNYPVNADAAGVVPKDTQAGESTNLVLGRDLGNAFTDRLKSNLGGDYFCGIDPSPDGSSADCPPMRFQVIKVEPADPDLLTQRQQVEKTKQQLESQELEGQLQQQQAATIAQSEAAKQANLSAQLKTAELQAQIDTAKCRVYAQYGMDCDGHRPQPIVAGGGG